jgi:hypothetical protein
MRVCVYVCVCDLLVRHQRPHRKEAPIILIVSSRARHRPPCGGCACVCLCILEHFLELVLFVFLLGVGVGGADGLLFVDLIGGFAACVVCVCVCVCACQ